MRKRKKSNNNSLYKSSRLVIYEISANAIQIIYLTFTVFVYIIKFALKNGRNREFLLVSTVLVISNAITVNRFVLIHPP